MNNFNLVKIEFKSEKTPGEVYELMISNVREAATLAVNNASRLHEIALDLKADLAWVERLEMHAMKIGG